MFDCRKLKCLSDETHAAPRLLPEEIRLVSTAARRPYYYGWEEFLTLMNMYDVLEIYIYTYYIYLHIIYIQVYIYIYSSIHIQSSKFQGGFCQVASKDEAPLLEAWEDLGGVSGMIPDILVGTHQHWGYGDQPIILVSIWWQPGFYIFLYYSFIWFHIWFYGFIVVSDWSP